MHRTTERFEERLRTLLPQTYQIFDDQVQPRSMGSAGLRFGDDGQVCWDKMWGSFCDLAMAGGPPHRGRLLEADKRRERTEGELRRMSEVSAEIIRGIGMVTGLCVEAASDPGWLRMYCTSAAMAGWLGRAVVMENVVAVSRGLSLFLPTGPAFRLEKEIKNVITSVAKSCHYWQDHMSEAKHEEIAQLLAAMDRETPFLQPDLNATEKDESLRRSVEDRLQQQTLLKTHDKYTDWAGLDCETVQAAIWMMRALVVENCAARREDSVVFVPLNSPLDPSGDRVSNAVVEAHQLACEYGIFAQSESTPD